MALTTVFAPRLPAEPWTLAATVGPDVPVISISDQPGITSTGTGDFVKSTVLGPFTLSGIPAGSVGYAAKEAGIYVDGTFFLPVTGGTVTTPQNTPVYAVVADGVVTSLTLSVGTNKLFGKVHYSKDLVRVAGKLPVQIGANL